METSIGLDRMFLAVFSNSLQEEALENGSRTVLKLPAVLAPIKQLFSIVKKDGFQKLAHEISGRLKMGFQRFTMKKMLLGNVIGVRMPGTPFCITVDHDSLEDNSVTIRFRDTMEQKRVKISEAKDIIEAAVAVKGWLKKMES